MHCHSKHILPHDPWSTTVHLYFINGLLAILSDTHPARGGHQESAAWSETLLHLYPVHLQSPLQTHPLLSCFSAWTQLADKHKFPVKLSSCLASEMIFMRSCSCKYVCLCCSKCNVQHVFFHQLANLWHHYSGPFCLGEFKKFSTKTSYIS